MAKCSKCLATTVTDHVFFRDTMTATCYVEDVLEPTLLLYLDGQPRVHFPQDNARPRIVRRTLKLLRETEVNVMLRPPLIHRI